MTEGYVYAMGADEGDIKIGWSVNPFKRLGSIRNGNSADVRLLGVLPGVQPDEKRIHRQLAKWRRRREWFERSPEVMAFIESMAPPSECHVQEIPLAWLEYRDSDLEARVRENARWDMSLPSGPIFLNDFVELIHSEHGPNFLLNLMDGCKAEWWRNLRPAILQMMTRQIQHLERKRQELREARQ